MAALGLACYRSPQSAAITVDRLRFALAGRMNSTQHLHATLVHVHHLGVLLLGASGSGKSELALDLVSRGHALVADDGVKVSRPAPGCLLGECPEPLRGFIEVRGLGILDLGDTYGPESVTERIRIDLAIRIDHADTYLEPMERVHGRRRRLELLGVALPEILLSARLGHNAVMVEAACRDHWSRLRGYVASETFVSAHDRRMSAESGTQEPP
jgi:HPr kinase/phosphorylase